MKSPERMKKNRPKEREYWMWKRRWKRKKRRREMEEEMEQEEEEEEEGEELVGGWCDVMWKHQCKSWSAAAGSSSSSSSTRESIDVGRPPPPTGIQQRRSSWLLHVPRFFPFFFSFFFIKPSRWIQPILFLCMLLSWTRVWLSVVPVRNSPLTHRLLPIAPDADDAYRCMFPQNAPSPLFRYYYFRLTCTTHFTVFVFSWLSSIQPLIFSFRLLTLTVLIRFVKEIYYIFLKYSKSDRYFESNRSLLWLDTNFLLFSLRPSLLFFNSVFLLLCFSEFLFLFSFKLTHH